MISPNQEQKIFLFIFLTQESSVFLPSHLVAQQLNFDVGTVDPFLSANLLNLKIYLFFLSKDVCGFRNSGQSLALPLCTPDLCGTRGLVDTY